MQVPQTASIQPSTARTGPSRIGPARIGPARTEDRTIDARELATACAQLADEKKAADIQVIEVTEQLRFADYFVIASGTSRAHVKALYDELHVRLKAAGHPHRPAEGADLGWWIVLDFGDVLVHLLQPEARDYYDIERLYADCPRLAWEDAAPVELPEPASR